MKTVTINIDTSRYREPTNADLEKAKDYVLKRSDTAHILQDLITELLLDAAVKICNIAYKYNFPGETFTIGASPEQQKEINAVMDELEEKILELLEEKSIGSLPNEDNDRKIALLTFMLALGHANRNLRDTLFNYLWRFLYDLEAAIAALKKAGKTLTQAIAAIRSHITAIYTIPELIAAIKKPNAFLAAFIRTGGVPYNPDGSQNSQGVPREGFNAVINTILITNDIIWGKNQLLDFIASGAVGYYQLRGSTYPCAQCDDEVGLHIGIIDEDPLPHPHCCCIRIPIYQIVQ